MNNRVLIQCKDMRYKEEPTKLVKATVKDVVGKFKESFNNLKDSPNRPPAGFILCGGAGMTKGATKEWTEFQQWCQCNRQECEYLTEEDLIEIRNELRNRTNLMYSSSNKVRY